MKQLLTPAIFIPAFSRPHALDRLLQTLEAARYPNNNIELVISLDGQFHPEVEAVAERFKLVFSHGNVTIIKRTDNIGLRNHILWCGDQTEKFGAIIVLEDDLIVSELFYMYATAAVRHFHDDDQIAGIALYSQRYNEYVNLPFEPLNTMRENYFMQIACSWGQVWTKDQWQNFKQWYVKTNDSDIKKMIEIPEYVRGWPESSWKKYFSAYVACNHKYFVYPYISYTSNCGDMGGHHNSIDSNLTQIALATPILKEVNFNFVDIDQGGKCYDPFMEPQNLTIHLDDLSLNPALVEIDLYGSKSISLLRTKEYSITTKKSHSPIHFFPLKYKPIENNFLYSQEANKSSIIVLTKSSNICKDTRWRKKVRHVLLASYYSFFYIRTLSFVLMLLFYVYF